MSAYLVVDASCDLPATYIKKNRVGILPVHVSIAGREIIDNKNEDALRQFYQDDLLSLDIKARTKPWTSSQISEYILNDVVSEHRSLLIETVAKSRSAIFENAYSASHTVTQNYRNYQEGDDRFSMRVMDSGSMFAGMGVLVMHTNKLIQNGHTISQLRKELEGFKEQLWVYAIPKDVKHLRARVKQRGDNSVSWLAANVVNILDIAPVICGHDGDTYPVGKIKGFNNAVNKLVIA
ncbi:hypothetical protein ACH42_14515 [Endozoicomonas sp. (ex Bugula neritina AB1)]|nr:hypothetical protein ACH42_14515 [Endozoicomonas sp. (ex Bugula neritina AB1)]